MESVLGSVFLPLLQSIEIIKADVVYELFFDQWEIYRIIDDLVKSGAGVLVISSELPEVVGVADRVLVMREGHIVGEVGGSSGSPVSQESIIAYATGAVAPTTPVAQIN